VRTERVRDLERERV